MAGEEADAYRRAPNSGSSTQCPRSACEKHTHFGSRLDQHFAKQSAYDAKHRRNKKTATRKARARHVDATLATKASGSDAEDRVPKLHSMSSQHSFTFLGG